MTGNISLGDFIKEVKEELVKAQQNVDNPFFELKEVNLEVSFLLDASAKAGAKLFVVEIGGETKASQTHKINLKLEPIADKVGVSGPSSSRPRYIVEPEKRGL